MKTKEITAEQFAMETRKFLGRAQRSPIVVLSEEGPALVLRAVNKDDLADELVTAHPKFRASVRRARKNRAAGKGVPLNRVKDML